MAKTLRIDMPHSTDARRRAVGIMVSSGCARVSGTLIATTGRGLDVEADIVGSLGVDVPGPTVSMFVAAGGATLPARSLAAFRAKLTEIETLVAGELLTGLGVAAPRVLVAGVHDPGLWGIGHSGPIGCISLCDAARLAEATGLNVVDAFPARDLAQGGLGGPLTAVPEWILLKHARRNRVLLDLGRSVRMTYLPAVKTHFAASRVLSFEVGPGTRMLDLLVERLTGGEHRFDPGGRLSVQGRRITELIEHWLADPYFDRPLPRWHPRGVGAERFLTDALQKAVDSQWSVRDLLCSATHFIAETVALALRTRIPEDAQIDELVVTGGGQLNGMLLREIGRTTDLPLIGTPELGFPDGSLEPACVALLALLHVDQVPANQTAITKADVPRPLGRLTPGSPQSWQQLIHASRDSSTAKRPLRSAM
ncbi:MAG: anhydro-N-acetylmuramic acid kinase [Candidatus Nealsonbacteria bacterium]|nr:anhydro-N-acetylmuramic acid kinase [Candidatus Nealsonbacteria bacterium]